ncbi:MAG: hypothetical protein JO109_17190, partial [Alphaproteobacteria bacterium]|nr:hypothetical protein [Alphaproteobacteria bacterium]
MVTLLLALAAMQAAPGPVRLECVIPPPASRPDFGRMHLSVSLMVDGRRIESAVIDGPRPFSSYRIVEVRRDSPELGAPDP